MCVCQCLKEFACQHLEAHFGCQAILALVALLWAVAGRESVFIPLEH